MLTIYKASAGSGKTFQLVVEYLKLLLKNPFNYKHILAVTFTNKATNEMKTRILEQLYLLASNHESNYIKELQTETISETIIRANAKIVLKNILHDYNRFSISTIDSFTQRIIKSFNRELGISPNFTLELDSEMILSEAVDRMMAKIDKDKKLLKWLKDFSKEKIEETKSQRIDDNIKALGKELFKENFQLFFPDDSESVYSRENLDSFTKELRAIISGFKKSIQNWAKMAMEAIWENDFTIDDFSYKKSGVAGYLNNLANGIIKEPGTRVLAAEDNAEKWYGARHDSATEIHLLVVGKLQPLLHEIVTYFTDNEAEYYTAVVVNRQIRMLGILTDLKEEIKILLHEKGILQISDSNLLLSKIIGQSDSPFIYEKTGSYFHHFMLDEFQDTSTLQWQNFKPLIINSLAEGNENLIVGDVKQSIYRWRNSDWKILAEQIYSDFRGGQLKEIPLEYNWRSDKNIIQFNNAIFESLKATFENTLMSEFDDEAETYSKKFDNIYNLFVQKPGIKNSPETGFVDVRFLPAENFQEESTETLVEQVKMLQDKGIKASEIAILIRKNIEGTPVIDAFLKAAGQPENKKYNLSVLSNESLFLYASRGVLFVMETIEFLIDPENKITKVSLLNLWLDWLKPELQKVKNAATENNTHSLDENFETLFETELAPQLELIKEKILLTSLDETITQISAQFNLFDLESELPFLQTLIDKAGELKTSLSNDLSNLLFWWNEKGFKTSVNVNEDIDSIRLLTVHRSKGLEFKAVLLPYLDWDTSWRGTLAPTLWCKPETEPFNKFPLLPVVAGTDMKKSHFKTEYFTEKANVIIDTFNLIYVAFTRAKSALFINCPAPKENSRTPGKSANNLLKESLETLSSQNPFSKCWNAGHDVFQFGTLPTVLQQTENSRSVLITKYQFNDFGEKIKLRATGEDFLIAEEKSNSIKNRGKIIHDILADIETGEEIKSACLKAFNNGIINETELAEIEATLESSLKNPQIAHWFDGSYEVINERSLLTADRILRPDRIMISGNSAIVVDYKTGAKKSVSYNRQVTRYAETLKETGIANVTGFLWYINQNEVEKVCEL
jgi:ATP-dependent exoDNAse (exonuclease V) beta subunit